MTSGHQKSLVSIKHNTISSNNNTQIRENTDNIILIWLDRKINENNTECQHIISYLKTVINNVHTFAVDQECIQYLETTRNKKIYMIVSGSLGKNVVPLVHSLSQVDSIFIFCGNKQYHEQWVHNWQKIRDVYTDVKTMCDAINRLINTEEPNLISFSVLTTEDETSISTNLDRLDPMFIYMQVIKEILPMLKYEKKHITDFTKYCQELLKQDNENQLDDIILFENSYWKISPMWWFTKQSFVYSIINKAIRSLDIDMIVKMGFFIRDLQCQIDDFYSQQFSKVNTQKKSFTFYRQQTIIQEEYDQICRAHNGLICFHSFQFATTSQTIALNSINHTLSNSNLINILFVMKIDNEQSTIIFASAVTANACNDQANEILFGIQTIFRIKNISKSDDHENLSIIELEWTNENDYEFGILTNYIRNQTFTNREGWDRLGSVLLKLNKPKYAEKIYQFMFQDETIEIEKAWLYRQFGTCKNKQNNRLEAIEFYEKSIDIYETYSPNDDSLVTCYNKIAQIYYEINDFNKAIHFYDKVLLIQRSILHSYHPDLATTYYKIGLNYFKLNNYSKANLSYKKALKIGQQSISPNHPDLAIYYNAISQVYYKQNDYTKAFSYCEKALLIQQRSSSNNQADLAKYYYDIGTIYCMMNEYENALSSHEQALKIRQELSPSNHFDLASSYAGIGLIYENMKYYSRAHLFYAKAIRIVEESSLETHTDIQQWKDHLVQTENKY